MKIIIIRLIYVELARKTEKTSYYYMKTSNSPGFIMYPPSLH